MPTSAPRHLCVRTACLEALLCVGEALDLHRRDLLLNPYLCVCSGGLGSTFAASCLNAR